LNVVFRHFLSMMRLLEWPDMMKMTRIALPLALCLAVSSASVAQQHHSPASPYAGFQERAIKSLSAQDIEELQRGGGWGLALPAELNGVPGPAHLLELKDQIPLSPDQVDQTQELYETMKEAAILAGERLIAAEAAIEAAFASGVVDEDSLRQMLATAESARAELRFIHLSQHVKTREFLSPGQIERYNFLRGYAEDPCANVPAGHNVEMYRRHMGCQ